MFMILDSHANHVNKLETKIDNLTKMTCISAESEKSFYFSDLLLIQEVEKNPVLWDARLKGYRNEKAKAAIFRSIADKLGKHVEDVEFRWYALRRTYVRRKKAALDKSTDGVAVISWPLFKYLSFLAPSVRHRKLFNKSPIILRCEPEEIPNSSSDTPVILPVSHMPDLSEDEELKWWNAEEEGAEETPTQESQGSNRNSMSPSSIEIKKESVRTVNEIASHDNHRGTTDTDKLDRAADKFERDAYKLNNDTDKLDCDINELDRDNLDFFKSLLPMCRNFTNVQKLDFRLEVMNAVRKIMNSQ